MVASELLALLGKEGDEGSFAGLLLDLGTAANPGLDDDEPDQHYDWILIRSRGLEIGFADAAYFDGSPRYLWRTKGLLVQQMTFYGRGREGIKPFDGELPFGLQWLDTPKQARDRLRAYEVSRRSYLTDCWDVGAHRVVLRYEDAGRGIGSVHVKLRIPPLRAVPGGPAALAAREWFALFGQPAESPRLQAALAPMDLRTKIDDDEADEREIDCLEEGGLTLYFEESRRLQLLPLSKERALVLGAVKFYRARDLNARQYPGELPFGLSFEDSPSMLEGRVGQPVAYRKDGPTTGHARWHMDTCSLHVLYSTIENQIFRVMLMAPGYWREMATLA